MKTIVKGRIIKNTYSVIPHTKEIETDSGEIKTVYTEKPELKKNAEIVDWVDICSFDHEPFYNKRKGCYSLLESDLCINIGDEEVVVTEERFVADKDELHLYVDKFVEETDDLLGKEIAEIDYRSHTKAFNESLIATNEKMKAYCKLHHMDPEETDAIELFKLLYDTPFYLITDGEIYVSGLDSSNTKKELDDMLKNWVKLEVEE